MEDSSPLRLQERVVLDKWEGEVGATDSAIVERVWVENGRIVGRVLASEVGTIEPFDASTPPSPPTR